MRRKRPGNRAAEHPSKRARRRPNSRTTDELLVDLEITSIAAGGDGVGRADGRVVFVPRTAPGDLARVSARAVRGGRFARGSLVELIRASEARVEPPCPHYTVDRCGGCQLQHLAYDAQLEAKGGIIRDALVRIARRDVIGAHTSGPTADESSGAPSVGRAVPVHASGSVWRYRRKLTLGLRWTAADGWMAGLHRYDAPDEVFQLVDCPITDTAVLRMWERVMAAAHLLPLAASLRASVRTTEEGFALVVQGGEKWTQGGAFATALPELTEIWWEPARAERRRIDTGHRRDEVEGGAGARTGASFVQVNAEVSRELHTAVVRRALAHAPKTAVDAYAGTGATAVPLALAGVHVTAIEADPDAAAACSRSLPPGSHVIAGRVEHVLARALPADVVLLNPPRAGLAPAVRTALQTAEPRPRAILYVSCDPATLARDVAALSGWRMVSVEGFDMFPQTAHVETLCELAPGRAA